MKEILNFIVQNIWYVVYAVVFMFSMILTIISFIKEKSTKKKEALRTELKNKINGFIADAEKLKNYKGEERKQYVMTRAIAEAGKLMSQQEIDEFVEAQVGLTDCVNKHN